MTLRLTREYEERNPGLAEAMIEAKATRVGGKVWIRDGRMSQRVIQCYNFGTLELEVYDLNQGGSSLPRQKFETPEELKKSLMGRINELADKQTQREVQEALKNRTHYHWTKPRLDGEESYAVIDVNPYKRNKK